MPPFKREGRQLNQQQNLEGYQIASLRIHVERAIARLKNFGILNFVEHYLYKYVDQIIFVIAFLCNCGNDLIGSKKPKKRDAPKANVPSRPESEKVQENEEGLRAGLVCDLDDNNENDLDISDFDLDLDFDNKINFIDEPPRDDDDIEKTASKVKLTKDEIDCLLDNEVDDTNVDIEENDTNVTVVQEAAASTSGATTPNVSRSGRKLKKNPKYLQ